MIATIAGTTQYVQANNFGWTDRLGTRSTFSFQVADAAGYLFSTDQKVQISDPVLGNVFIGYVETSEMSYLPGTSTRMHTITCKNEQYLADKRYFTNPDNANRYAGDYMGDLYNDYLKAEGITAAIALAHDRSATDFATGTLTNTIVENGALTLAHNGTTFSVTETSQLDWSSGTLTNVQSNDDGTLSLASFKSVKFTGQCVSPTSVAAYNTRRVWQGSQIVQAGDLLQYGVWVASTCPDDTLSVDLIFDDHSTLTSIGGFVDQYGLAATAASLNGNATDVWYMRQIDLSVVAGKRIVGVSLSLQGSKQGAYAVYFRNIRITDATGTLIRRTLVNKFLGMNRQLGNTGYTNVSLTLITAYEKTGQRVSPIYPNTQAGSVKDSLVSWTADLPSQVLDTQNNNDPISISVSLDSGGFFYAPNTNGQPIPNLAPGTDLTGSYIVFNIVLTNYGATPEYSPSIADLNLTIDAGYYQVKTDVVDTDTTTANFSAGTLTNVQAILGGLQLNGKFKDWADGSLSGCNKQGTGNPIQTIVVNADQLTCDGGHEMRSHYSFAGNWQDFIAEMDVYVNAAGSTYGMVYRTTNWAPQNYSFGWLAYLTTTGVVIGYGTDNTTGLTWTQVSSVAATFQAGAWYRLRLEVAGTSHAVFVDDQQYISVTDSHFNQSGGIAARFSNGGTTRSFGRYANFGVVTAMTGTRVNPSLNLAPAGVVASSLIQWAATEPDVTTLEIDASFDNGVTWTQCTNNAAIPGLNYGDSLTGVSLLIREVLTTNNASTTPVLSTLSVRVVGQTNGSDGTRVSVPLSTTGVGPIDSTSVTWQADEPALTSLHIDTSIDNGVTWTEILTSGSPIPGITTAGPDYVADFHLDDEGSWLLDHFSGGSNSTWEWDITNYLLAARNGVNAVYVCVKTTAVDSAGDLILSRSDDGGVCVRYTSPAQHYRVIVHDDLSATNQQKLTVYKRVGGVDTQLDQQSISFVRGTFHALHWTIIGSALTVYWDGLVVSTVTDSSISTCTYSAALFNGSEIAWYHVFRSQQYGQSLSGSVKSRVRMATNDASVTPKVTDLTVSVRSKDIQQGAFISSSSYQYQKTVAAVADDLSQQSVGFWWNILAKKLLFQPRTGQFAPWPLASINCDIQVSTPPILKFNAPLYRNRQIITGAFDTIPDVPESKRGDGNSTSWTLSYPVYSAPTILLNGNVQSVGVAGIDTNKAYYWTYNSTTISQDKSLKALSNNDVLNFTYTGLVNYVAIKDDLAQQAALAAQDESSGIVEAVESCNGLLKADADQLAQARLAEYAILSQDWKFTTLRSGLASGQYLYVYVPEYELNNQVFLITEVVAHAYQIAGGTLVYYDVQCTSGPNLGSWSKLFLPLG